METGEQGEAAKLEDAGGRERLIGWRRLKGRARLLGWRRLVDPGRGCDVGGDCRWQGKDGEAEIVRWRWRGGRKESFVIGPVNTFVRKGREVFLLIGPDTTFIRK